MSAFSWCLLHAVEIHVVVALVLSGPRNTLPPSTEAMASVEVTLDEPLDRVARAAKEEAMPRAPVPSPSVGRPGKTRPHRGSPPAAAASAIALPEVGDPLPVASAQVYPGGLTSSLGTSDEAVGEVGSGGSGFLPGDLSAPAHLDGERHWACNVEGAPATTTPVHCRALVRPDGSAVRVEVLDRGELPDRVLAGAEPCAMAERYVPGRDREGRAVLRWTRPFRIAVVGL